MFSKETEECSMLDKSNGTVKLGLRNICLKFKKKRKKETKRKLILFLINISGELFIHDYLIKD